MYIGEGGPRRVQSLPGAWGCTPQLRLSIHVLTPIVTHKFMSTVFEGLVVCGWRGGWWCGWAWVAWGVSHRVPRGRVPPCMSLSQGAAGRQSAAPTHLLPPLMPEAQLDRAPRPLMCSDTRQLLCQRWSTTRQAKELFTARLRRHHRRTTWCLQRRRRSVCKYGSVVTANDC